MNKIPPEQVRSLVLAHLQVPLSQARLKPQEVRDDFDLLTEGIVDSQGVLELIVAVETHLGVEINFEEIDPEILTVIGPFCRYVSEKSSGNGNTTYSEAGTRERISAEASQE